ncbi:hypothetical protein BRADI_2g58806v3 [Brachypodium distachyon]|uniref:Uncharacterized protein n=1 Tax=Brachypodium distachyon TaxID=15368 RepID=A0A0Q3JFF0_BRADI|nr:hypothetical protein BRADI_2g58806v3 [Brachypodium distachyon]
MNRRFVNLVMKNYADCFYSLRRIDPYNIFFYGSAKAALEAADEAVKKKEYFPAMQTLQLPSPCMNFAAATPGGNLTMFALLSHRGTSEGRIVYGKSDGEAELYDADKNIHNSLGRLNDPKGIDPVCLPVVHPDDPDQSIMYVLDRYPEEREVGRAVNRCFEVLESVPKEAAALVDGNGYSTIYISASSGIGTYSFETARRDCSQRLGWRRTEEWSRVGPWQLPFVGSAQYVPDFNRWFGFTLQAPPPQVWPDVIPPQGKEWLVVYIKLLDLGNGKFLIAKTFEEGPYSREFTVLTGIEMMKAGGQSLQMVKHKCARFDFDHESIDWVL